MQPEEQAAALAQRIESLVDAASVGKPYAYCETGAPYIVFRTRGHSAEEALEALAVDLVEYVGGSKGTLYWRYEPKIEIIRNGAVWGAYTRLVVSDEPISPYHETGPHHCPTCSQPITEQVWRRMRKAA